MPRRWPAIPVTTRRLEEATKRIRIYGRIVGIEPVDAKITVDDGTGAAEVFLNSIELLEKLQEFKVGDFVVVIGWPVEGGVDCEILKKIDVGENFNQHLYIDIVEVIWNVSREVVGSDGSGESS